MRSFNNFLNNFLQAEEKMSDLKQIEKVKKACRTYGVHKSEPIYASQESQEKKGEKGQKNYFKK